MNLNHQQRAYIAGFLDGDGSIYVRAKPNTTYKYGYQIAPSIVLFQSEQSRDAFEQLHKIINLGYIRTRNDGILELTINKIADIQEFIEIVRPYTLFKKRQIELLEKIILAKNSIKSVTDFNGLLKLVDLYREFNYSKKRKVSTPVETER